MNKTGGKHAQPGESEPLLNVTGKLLTLRALVVILLWLAAWLFWHSPLAVPPGLEMDELIEAQIAGQVLQGDWRPFYEAGQGREGLYYYWLALWLALLGKQVFSLRLASTMVSLLGLAAIYHFMRRLFGPTTAVIGLAYAATTFWIVFAARSGLRSSALPLLAALLGVFFWRGLRTRHFSLPLLSAAGFLLGLSFHTYTAARILPFIFLLFVVYLFFFHRSWLSGRGPALLLAGLIALLTVLPLLNYLRIHPTSDQFDFMAFNRPLAALESGDPEPALQTSLATLGMFIWRGDPLIFDNVPYRPIFNLPNSLFFLLGVGLALARWRRPAYAFIVLWLLVALLPGMLSQPAPNFYRTVSAQVVTFVFPALSIVTLGRYLRQYWPHRIPFSALSVGLVLLLLGSHLLSTWRAYFIAWPSVEGITFFWQRGLAQAADYLEDAPANSAVALCTSLIYEHDPWWRPAWQSMPYLLPGNDHAIRYYDCRQTLVLPVGQPVRYLFPDSPAPTTLLPPEFQSAWLEQAATIPGVFPTGEGTAVRVEELPLDLLPGETAAWFAPEAGGAGATLPVYFGDSFALLSYSLMPARPQPGESLRLLTAWEVRAAPPPRLALFTHLLANPQTLITQQDGLGLTSHSLRPGDRFLVLHDQLAIPSELPPGSYPLAIGLYSSDTLLRLSLFQAGRPRGDRLFLKPVVIGE